MWRKGSWLLPRLLAGARVCSMGSGEGIHSPNISLQSALQTPDGGGPSTHQPMGAAVQMNFSGLPQSHA